MGLRDTQEDGISGAAITVLFGSIVLYVGPERFHKSTTKTLEYVVNQVDMTVRQPRDVLDAPATAKQIGVDKVFLRSNVKTDIDEIGAKINSSSSTLADKTVDNSQDTRDFLDSLRVAVIVIAAIMLLPLTFLGFLFSIFGMQLLVYMKVNDMGNEILFSGVFSAFIRIQMRIFHNGSV